MLWVYALSQTWLILNVTDVYKRFLWAEVKRVEKSTQNRTLWDSPMRISYIWYTVYKNLISKEATVPPTTTFYWEFMFSPIWPANSFTFWFSSKSILLFHWKWAAANQGWNPFYHHPKRSVTASLSPPLHFRDSSLMVPLHLSKSQRGAGKLVYFF